MYSNFCFMILLHLNIKVPFLIYLKRQLNINTFFMKGLEKGQNLSFLLFIMGQPLVGQIYFCWCITAEVPQVEVALE